MPRWKPGSKNGKKVAVYYSLRMEMDDEDYSGLDIKTPTNYSDSYKTAERIVTELKAD